MKQKDFKPHTMYNPTTGKGVRVTTYKQHVDLTAKKYTHSKPKTKRRSFTEAVESRVNKGGY